MILDLPICSYLATDAYAKGGLIFGQGFDFQALGMCRSRCVKFGGKKPDFFFHNMY